MPRPNRPSRPDRDRTPDPSRLRRPGGKPTRPAGNRDRGEGPSAGRSFGNKRGERPAFGDRSGGGEGRPSREREGFRGKQASGDREGFGDRRGQNDRPVRGPRRADGAPPIRGAEPRSADSRASSSRASGSRGDSRRRDDRPTTPPPVPARERSRPRPQRPRGHLAEAAEKPAMWVPGPDARVVRAEANLDLAHFLVNHTGKRISVRAARRALESGACRVNGKVETFGSRILRLHDVVEFFMPEDHEHHFDRKRVLLDDVGVLAYDKPPFLPVTPTDGPKSWSLLDILKPKLGDLYPVHRLDADTSGIVLFARNEDMGKRMEALFKEHAVEKTYLALVRGHPPETGERRSYLVKVESRKGFEKWASGRGPDAREAITSWKVLERVGRYASLVEVKPKTGRYHQIRIHFSEMGFPLYGDRMYSDRQDPVHCVRHMLHASVVKLPHPAGGPALMVTSALPLEFGEAAEKLANL